MNLSWQDEMKGAFRDASALENFLGLPVFASAKYPLFVPPSLANRLKDAGPSSILAKQFLPQHAEDELTELGEHDPIGDQKYLRAPGIIHRYPNRALFLPTTVCPVLCRYCFRKNELVQNEAFGKNDFAQSLAYLKEHSEIQEIIFTGGDPFVLSDEKIGQYLEAFSKIAHLKYVRFHTRLPMVMPSRLTEALAKLLGDYRSHFKEIQVVIHANHLSEFNEEVEAGLAVLKKSGLNLLSQTVLLAGINNSVGTLAELFEKLHELEVRPYYLHHPDQVRGGMHFWLPIEEGRRIYGALREKIPSWMLPQYVWDVPGGEGKVPLFNPEGYAYSGQILGRHGELLDRPEPQFPPQKIVDI